MAGRLRVRLEPRTQTTQKLSTKLIKYAGISLGVVALISGIIIIYSNLAESEDTFAKGSSSAYADKALQFDGDNDYVNLGSVNGNFSDQFTVMSWIKWNVAPSTGNPWANIFTINSSKEADDGIFWLQHTSDNSRFEFAVESSKGRNYVQSTIQPVKDVWYHVAGVYNGSTIKLYINGVLEGTVNHSGSIPKPKKDYEVTIGQWAYSGDQYRRFSGVIDEVSAWDYAMNPSDIRKYMTTKVPEKEKNLIMNFPFDEGSGKNAGSTNNSKYKGSIAGASWVDSGAPISSETSYQAKNNQKKYSHTFSNGYTLELNNMSKDPEAVYFYFIEDNADVSLEFNFTEYIFPTGIMGAYVIDREAVVYDAKFFIASKANSSGRTEQGKPIVLTRNSTTGQMWNTQDNVESTSLFTLNISSSQIETAIGEPSMALPIVLEYFKGRSAGQEGVELEWVTTMEENNDFFTIERSADGQNFDIIEKIPGAGNSKERLHYTTVDAKPLAGTNYYRLKQTDYDGKFEYSNIINVYSDKKQASGFAIEKVYPNPFIDKLNVDLVATEGPVIVTFANAGGNIVQQESFNASGGHDTFEIVASSRLEKGIYLVTFMQSGHEPKVIRVMKN